MCLLALALAAPMIGAVPAFAHAREAVAFLNLLPATSPRALAAELKAAQERVDASLLKRKKRLEAWRKAGAARDKAAQRVQEKKRAHASGAELEDVLTRALVLDEKAARARTELLTVEAEVGVLGAELLRLYDLLLVERRKAVEGGRPGAVEAYRELTTQRDNPNRRRPRDSLWRRRRSAAGQGRPGA
jgi:hypothetical protein